MTSTESRESEHPATCDGDLARPGDPTTWTSWLSILDPTADSAKDRTVWTEAKRVHRMRRFHNHACACQWIEARRPHQKNERVA
jgi:hypothetical protein